MDKEKLEHPHPFDNASILSRILYFWVAKLFVKGCQVGICSEDLTDTPKHFQTRHLQESAEKIFHEKQALRNKCGKSGLLIALAKAFLTKGFIISGILAFFKAVVFGSATAVFLGLLTGSIGDNHGNLGIWYAVGLVLCTLGQLLSMHVAWFSGHYPALQLRIAITNLVYIKAFRLKKTTLDNIGIGKLLNMCASDVQKIEEAFLYLHNVWSEPLRCAVNLIIMWQFAGIATATGFVIILLVIPLQILVGNIFTKIRQGKMTVSDARVGMMNEILSAMRCIKTYAWEAPFLAKLAENRRKELGSILKMALIKAIDIAIYNISSKVTILFTFIVLILTGGILRTETVFLCITFYAQMRISMAYIFPLSIKYISEAIVGLKRTEDFLLMEEDFKATRNNAGSDPEKKGVWFRNAEVKWSKDGASVLKDVSFSLDDGRLLAIVGKVGSGKTTLLLSILGESITASGSVKVNGSVAYVPQEPWLFPSTIRENILFGQPFNDEKYWEIVRICSLSEDLNSFPDGELTLVGDKGITLSGGQQSRIGLARALYSDADIYLLDDPMSAVDAIVARNIFNNCIKGYLKDKIVILVTHHVHFLQHVNCDIVVLSEGMATVAIGTDKIENEPTDKYLELPKIKPNRVPSEKKMIPNNQNTIKKEETRTGEVPGRVYYKYFATAYGFFGLLCITALTLLVVAISCVGDYWLSYWSDAEESWLRQHAALNYTFVNDTKPHFTVPIFHYNFTTHQCLIVFSIFVAGLVVTSFLFAFLFYAICLKSSSKLHENMVRGVIGTNMQFFDDNPIGRILNRFANDMVGIDEILPVKLMDGITVISSLLGVMILATVSYWWLSISAIIFLIVSLLMWKIYVKTSCDVKRVDSTTRSTMFAHMSSSFRGLTSIRSFNNCDDVIKQFQKFQDLNTSAWFLCLSMNRALAEWVDVACLLLLVATSIIILSGKAGVTGGEVGLALYPIIQLISILQLSIRQSSEAANQMTSVERILEYSKLRPEESRDKKPHLEPHSWPNKGDIQYDAVSLQYKTGSNLALKNVNCFIRAGEKIGIVGRTGAGKSSLSSSLLQLCRTSGTILIDNVDISKLALQTVRQAISIIPQESVVFSATVRFNIDPFEKHSDAELWETLERVQLKAVVENLEQKLDTRITAANFSVGQKQLMSLARVLLRDNKIVIFDEATSSMDIRTEEVVQQVLDTQFADRTVLIIAHRLDMVLKCDKIMVMDAGKIAEYDTPQNLLQQCNGLLFQLLKSQTEAMNKES